MFVECSALFHALFDKFTDCPVQAVRGLVAGRSADKIGCFVDLVFRHGDFTLIFRQRCPPLSKTQGKARRLEEQGKGKLFPPAGGRAFFAVVRQFFKYWL